MGLGRTHKQEFKMRSTYTTKKKWWLMQIEWKWCMDLIGTILSISFTWPATFVRRHHSPPYSILCASPWGLHPNVIFPQDSQVGVPKLGLLLSQNFRCSHLFQIKFFFKVRGQYLISLENIFPMMYSTVQLNLI